MTVDVLDGPLGLEARLRLGVGGLLLNEQGVWPRTKFDSIIGLHSLPDSDDPREARQGSIGEDVYPGQARGKTITYNGRVMGRTLPELRRHAAAVRSALGDRRLERDFIIEPHPTWGVVTWRYGARVLAYDADDAQDRGRTAVPTPWQREFVLTVRMSDPRFFVASGAWPFVGANDGDPANALNAGLAPTEPLFIINGPIPDLLTVERTGNPSARKLVFDAVGLAAGQQLRLDFFTRRLTRVSDGADFTNRIVFEESDWWDEDVYGLELGNTVVEVNGGANWNVSWPLASW